jgi:hypothetical protein
MKWVERKLGIKILYIIIVIFFICAILVSYLYNPKSKKDKKIKNIVINILNLTGFIFLLCFQYLIKFREGFFAILIAVIVCLYTSKTSLLNP